MAGCTDRKNKRSFHGRPARRGCPPERLGARRSTVQRGFGWGWTGATGWDRGGPLGVLGRLAGGQFQSWVANSNGISNAPGVRYTSTVHTSPTRPRTTLWALGENYKKTSQAKV